VTLAAATLKELKSNLYAEEGYRKYPYRCSAGKLTIGIGRNIEDRGISEDEAEYLLVNDIAYCDDALSQELAFYVSLDEVRKLVLVDMAFNMGIEGLLEFKNTLAYIAAGNYKAASIEMLDSDWAKEVGNRALRLSKMMETGGFIAAK
jgi:lysozyme